MFLRPTGMAICKRCISTLRANIGCFPCPHANEDLETYPTRGMAAAPSSSGANLASIYICWCKCWSCVESLWQVWLFCMEARGSCNLCYCLSLSKMSATSFLIHHVRNIFPNPTSLPHPFYPNMSAVPFLIQLVRHIFSNLIHLLDVSKSTMSAASFLIHQVRGIFFNWTCPKTTRLLHLNRSFPLHFFLILYVSCANPTSTPHLFQPNMSALPVFPNPTF